MQWEAPGAGGFLQGENPRQALQRSRRDERMNEDTLIGSASADLYNTLFFLPSFHPAAVKVAETN